MSEKMSKLIDRQKVLNEIEKNAYRHTYIEQIMDIIKFFPSAQSEIIHCRDCKYFHPNYCEVWSRYGTVQTIEDGFCHKAERRTDG